MAVQHHVFLSYARVDNEPLIVGKPGWVTAFAAYLKKRHQHFASQELKIFFDVENETIPDDSFWRDKILSGLRSSRLFVAFLSPAWLANRYCRWELEEYLRHEHSLARGSEGIKQIYLVAVPDLETDTPPNPSDFAHLVQDLRARQRDNGANLVDLYASGEQELIDALMQEDAVTRLCALREEPEGSVPNPLTSLATKLGHIDISISRRLDEALFAEAASAFGRLDASYERFVGRADQLRQLHQTVTTEKLGLISALHGLGGQGKTALAVQYAHAYAGFYACGGRWQIGCEGVDRLSSVFARLPACLIGGLPELPKGLPEAEIETYLIDAYKQHLKSQTVARHQEIVALRNGLNGGHGSQVAAQDHQPRMLLILDNVDKAGLLNATALASLGREDWLEIIVTTRMAAREVGGLNTILPIEVGDLLPADAIALLASFRPFVSNEDERAGRNIVAMLAGFTLAIELVGAELSVRIDLSWADMAARLQADLSRVDALSAAQKNTAASLEIRHRDKQIGVILNASLATLPPHLQVVARTTLDFASFFPSEGVVLNWLRDLVGSEHPAYAKPPVHDPLIDDPWEELLRVLDGRRLMPIDKVIGETGLQMARMHRLLRAISKKENDEQKQLRIETLLGLIGTLKADSDAKINVGGYTRQRSLSNLALLACGLVGEGFDSEMACFLLNLGATLCAIGLFDNALATAQQAVSIYRALAYCEPTAHSADLAMSLNNLGVIYSKTGQRDAAFTAAQEAVNMLRGLVANSPAEYERLFANSLTNLSSTLSNLGLRDAAYAVANEALQIVSGLASRDSLSADPDLALSLRNWSARLSEAGNNSAALTVAKEAVALYRILSACNPVAYSPDLAGALVTLAAMFAQVGQSQEALRASEEAVSSFRVLVSLNPALYQYYLAGSLTNLALGLSETGRAAEGVAAAQEAVDIRRALATVNPDGDTPMLASCLGALGQALSRVGKFENSKAILQEALQLILPFVNKNQAAFDHIQRGLATDLQNARLGLGPGMPPLSAPMPLATSWRSQWPHAASRVQFSMSLSKLEALLDRCWRIGKEDPEQFVAAVKHALGMERLPQITISAFVDSLESSQ